MLFLQELNLSSGFVEVNSLTLLFEISLIDDFLTSL
jgi:hypothetical protein